MAKTSISWASHSRNPFVGCSLASPGCTNCYAMHQAARIVLMQGGRNAPSHYEGTTAKHKGEPVWTGQIRRAPEKIRFEPLTWRDPRTVFVSSMSDFFHPSADDAWRIEALAVMALTPRAKFLILTKRAFDMRRFVNDPATANAVWARVGALAIERKLKAPRIAEASRDWPLKNVALGVSAEDQKRADERIPDLRETLAAQRFVSLEPLLGPVPSIDFDRIDLVIAGGENDLGDRPTHPAWLRALRDQCAAAGVGFHFKQWGKWAPAAELPQGRATEFFELEYQVLGEASASPRVRYLATNGKAFATATAEAAEAGAIMLLRIGTADSGRNLDGREHNDVLEAGE